MDRDELDREQVRKARKSAEENEEFGRISKQSFGRELRANQAGQFEPMKRYDDASVCEMQINPSLGTKGPRALREPADKQPLTPRIERFEEKPETSGARLSEYQQSVRYIPPSLNSTTSSLACKKREIEKR